MPPIPAAVKSISGTREYGKAKAIFAMVDGYKMPEPTIKVFKGWTEGTVTIEIPGESGIRQRLTAKKVLISGRITASMSDGNYYPIHEAPFNPKFVLEIAIEGEPGDEYSEQAEKKKEKGKRGRSASASPRLL